MKRGYSIIEMVLYVATLVFMLVVMMNVLRSIIVLERQLASSRAIENSAAFGIERLVREIRQAKSVNVGSSTLDVNPGRLVLNSTDSSGAAETVEFFVQNGVMRLKINGSDRGALTESKTTLSRLVFSRMATSTTEAIRTQITLESGTSTTYKTANFYSTTLLRGSL
ncbi:MAG: hypothetical protein V4465_01030 [Patescibacteria group bacterium]